MRPEASIDFEFRSGTDIGLGLPAYLSDKEAEPLCLAFDMNDMMGVYLWTPGQPCPPQLVEHIAAGGVVRGWNVIFEWHVWNLVMAPRYGWPELPLRQCVCTMAEAAAMNLPQGLDKCGPALGLSGDKVKSGRGKALIQILCVPQKEPVAKPPEHYRSKGAYTRAVNDHARWVQAGGRWINDPELMQELHDYCMQDVVAEMAIKRRLRRLNPFERQVWLKTQFVNLRGVPIDMGEVKRIAQVVEAETDRLNEELQALTDGAASTGMELANIRDWINARLPVDYYLRDLQSETVEATLLLAAQPDHAHQFTPAVKRVLQIRASVGQTSTAKLAKMLRVVAADGTLKNMHVYHGASTGRDASRGGVNLQNLKSPIIQDVELAIELLARGDHAAAYLVFGEHLMDALVSVVRGVIKAPPGYEFTDGDFSSVENRVSAWIARQEDKLDLFRQGLDEYKTFGTKIFACGYDDITPVQRKFSKPGVLGGMFGQGARGLVDYAARMGVFLTLEKAQEITDLYRTEYRKVRNLWYRCGDAAVAAIRTPKQWVKAERLELCVMNNFLWMRLPSQRVIAWADPEIVERPVPWDDKETRPCASVMHVNPVTHQWCRTDLIGSSIFQSGVQGTARDLLMHAMFNVEAAGYRVVLRVHDELLSCNPEGFGSCDEYGLLMCRSPEWAADLPLAYEAWRGKRFRK